MKARPERDRFIRSKADPGRLPSKDEDIAFASVTQLSRWIEQRKISSERLMHLYLDRLEQFNPKLRCVITLTRELALEQAKKADEEIAAGRYRGPLHGIPWGGKDLLDTAGIPTTYGAETFRNRVPTKDAAVVKRLHDAGAVLVAKLNLGALALNDIWFGGQTMNPWLLEEGASGSSAGPGAATAAGLVGFSIGSETEGSIISPSMRCGVTGLRPTYGRVPRSGAMTLCWSLDKLGPMTRSVEDAMLVLQTISGPDAGDLASVPSKLDFDAGASVQGLRVGYFPGWMKDNPATDVDRIALEAVKKVGMVPVEAAIPDWPYDSLQPCLPKARLRSRRSPSITMWISLRCRCPTPGPTLSASRGSFPRWTSCRPTGCAEKWPWRWPASSLKWTCYSCPRCATKCLLLRTSPDIPR